jgi:hypothetical protein
MPAFQVSSGTAVLALLLMLASFARRYGADAVSKRRFPTKGPRDDGVTTKLCVPSNAAQFRIPLLGNSAIQ